MRIVYSLLLIATLGLQITALADADNMTDAMASASIVSDLEGISDANFASQHDEDLDDLYAVVVIGGGPAGLASSIYAARASLPTAVVSGEKPGGQLASALTVENIPGLVRQEGILVTDRLLQQAEGFGADILYDSAVAIDGYEWPFTISLESGKKIKALSLIIATGGSPRRLLVPGEMDYWGHGVSTCARCDALFFKDQDVVLVGGGDSTLEYIQLLAPYVRSITLIVRGKQMRATPQNIARVDDYKDLVSVMMHTKVVEIRGDGEQITTILVEDTETGQQQEVPASGIFLAIGHNPNTALVASLLPLTPDGHIELFMRHQQTCIPGIFAAGEVADRVYRQAIVAMGQGAQAGLDAVKFLQDLGISDRAFKDCATGKRCKSSLFTPRSPFDLVSTY